MTVVVKEYTDSDKMHHAVNLKIKINASRSLKLVTCTAV